MENDETALSASLETYRSQLSQVEATLQVVNEEAMKTDLEQLQSDLQQLIQLTEQNLLCIKKNRLLTLLNSSEESSTINSCHERTASYSSRREPAYDMDKEFAAFQEAISGDVSDTNPTGEDNSQLSLDDRELKLNSDTDGDGDEEDLDGADAELDDELSGTKCRAPFSHSWGELSYHNALVLCSLPDQSQVRVLYCNPTHSSMRPCPYFLEGKCHYDALHCRFSHGETVDVTDLKPFLEPDYSTVSIGIKCLARDTDDIWSHATVVDLLDDDRFHIMFDANHRELKLDAQDVFPLSGSYDDADESSTLHEVGEQQSTGVEEEDELPVYLWHPGQTTDAVGQWEQHTRGIGSRIMAKMGYIVGQGLGKNSEGRAEPVPIQLLPQGKSLDKIMELKQLAGDRDLYDAFRKQKKQQKKVDAQAAKGYVTRKGHTSVRTFDFINKKLGDKRPGGWKGLTKQSGTSKNIDVKHISANELEKKSNKHLNIQLCKTHEELRNAEKEIIRLRSALERNEKQDQVMAKQIRAKLESMQEYVGELRNSESFIKQQQMTRNARTSLTKF